jgi:RNA polymerase sigma-70 factor (ECF subfamily)
MEALRKQLARNVDTAFSDLLAEFRDGLYSGVSRLVPQSADAEDICAETFLRAYRALKAMPPQQIRRLDLAPWMWTIALNLCRNAARRRSRKPWVRLDPSWNKATAERGPEVQVVERSRVEMLLEELPPQQRTAVVLRYVVDLPYADIAAATGRPEGSVKSDVTRGLQRLRRTEGT